MYTYIYNRRRQKLSRNLDHCTCTNKNNLHRTGIYLDCNNVLTKQTDQYKATPCTKRKREKNYAVLVCYSYVFVVF